MAFGEAGPKTRILPPQGHPMYPGHTAPVVPTEPKRTLLTSASELPIQGKLAIGATLLGVAGGAILHFQGNEVAAMLDIAGTAATYGLLGMWKQMEHLRMRVKIAQDNGRDNARRHRRTTLDAARHHRAHRDAVRAHQEELLRIQREEDIRNRAIAEAEARAARVRLEEHHAQQDARNGRFPGQY